MAKPCPVGDDLAKRGGIGIRTAHQTLQSANAFRPIQRENDVFDREHRGGVDGFALEHAFG